MRLLGARQLSVLLAGTLLLCHGAFGALHLVCCAPQCAGDDTVSCGEGRDTVYFDEGDVLVAEGDCEAQNPI